MIEAALDEELAAEALVESQLDRVVVEIAVRPVVEVLRGVVGDGVRHIEQAERLPVDNHRPRNVDIADPGRQQRAEIERHVVVLVLAHERRTERRLAPELMLE